MEFKEPGKKKNLNKWIYLTLNNSLISRAGAWASWVAWIKDNSYCEILETRLIDFEYSLFFEDFFDDLKEKCLRGVKLIVSDGLKVIREEIVKSFLDQAFRYIASSNKTSAQDGAKKEAKTSDWEIGGSIW